MQNQSPGAAALPAEDLALISIAVVSALVGLKDSAIWDRVKEQRMPAPLRLSRRCSRFRAGDIRVYLQDPLNWTPGKAIDAATTKAAA